MFIIPLLYIIKYLNSGRILNNTPNYDKNYF